MLKRTNTGIATFDGPRSEYSVSKISFENLEDYLSSILSSSKELDEKTRTQAVYVKNEVITKEHQIVLVYAPDSTNSKFLRPYRAKRCNISLKELPEKPSETFLDHFFKNKVFAFFHITSQSLLPDELVEQIIRFSVLLPIVIIMVEDNNFGINIERSLRANLNNS